GTGTVAAVKDRGMVTTEEAAVEPTVCAGTVMFLVVAGWVGVVLTATATDGVDPDWVGADTAATDSPSDPVDANWVGLDTAVTDSASEGEAVAGAADAPEVAGTDTGAAE